MHSLGTRLIVLLTACAVLIFGTGMLLDYRLSRQEILDRVVTQSVTEMGTVVADLENWLSGVEGATRLLAQVLERQVVPRDELRAMLRDVVTNNSEIFGAAIALHPGATRDSRGFAPYFYRHDGAVRYADLTTREADYQNQEWFRQPLDNGQPQWSEPYFDRGGGEVDMTTYSVPIFRQRDGQRRPYAVVTADVRLADLQQLLEQLRQGPNTYSILLSSGGLVMSGRARDRVLRHFSDAAGIPAGSAVLERVFRHALDGEDATLDIPCPESGSRCTMRVSRLETTGWPIAIVYDQRRFLAPLQAYTLKTSLISAATLFLMAVAVYFVTARQTRPLRALSRAAERIGSGDLDHPLPHARGRDEIARLVQAFNTMIRNLRQHIDDLAAATASRSRLEGELAAARDIQMSLLPGGGEALRRDGRCSVWARVEPARTVGGDFYAWQAREGQLWFAVGDVSDKGVPAALFMSRAASLLNQLAETAHDPPELLAGLNELLCRDNPTCMFVTLFLGLIDTRSGLLQYASAGHPAPSLRQGQNVDSLAPDSGPPLGLAPGQDFPLNQLALKPGDCLAVFTDGVEEAFDHNGEMFGLARFNTTLGSCDSAPIAAAGEQLFAAVAGHAGDAAQSDDITILLLRYWPASNAAFRPGDKLVSRVTQWLEARLLDWEIPPGIASETVLLAEEMVSNIDKYAQLEADDRISLQLVCAGSVLALEVRDPGRAFNPLADGERAVLDLHSQSAGIGGLGVHLIEKLSDDQRYRREDGYNVLRVEKVIPFVGDVPVQYQRPGPGTGTGSERSMKLTTTVAVDETRSLARVHLDGALNTDTAPDFERRLQAVADEGHQLIVLDMKDLDYISSAGLRVIFKAAKQIHGAGNTLAAANRKPHIDKVFEILKALPDMAVFADDDELDDYLDHMQQQVKNGE